MQTVADFLDVGRRQVEDAIEAQSASVNAKRGKFGLRLSFDFSC
jgi:hypothetical protein